MAFFFTTPKSTRIPGAAGHRGGVGRRQVHLAHGRPQGLDAIRLAVPRRDRRAQADLSLPIRAVDPGRGDAALDLDQVVEPDETAALPGDVEPRDGARAIPIDVRQANVDVIVLADAGIAEARDLLLPAHADAEGGGDLRRVHAEVRRARPIDPDEQLRLLELERGIRVEDAAELDGSAAEALPVFRQRLEVGPAQDEVDLEATAADVERGRVAHGEPEIAELAQPAPDLLHDVALAVVSLEGRERLTAREAVPEA